MTTTRVPSRAELLDRARLLVPVLRERALTTERLRRLPRETVDDLVASGLIRLGVPERFGGWGAEYDLAYDVAIELGRGCGSSAWCYSLWAVHAWMIGHWPEPAQVDFFSTAGADTLCSSSFAARSVKAEPCEGGLRLSGEWEFSSGSDPSHWAVLGTGTPFVLALVPRSDYQIVDTWHVSGLCGTGSNDIAIPEPVFVPDYRILDLTRAGVEDLTGWELHHQANYHVPLRVLLAWDLVAPLVGIALGAVEEFTARFAASLAADSDVIRLRLAEASAEADAARALLRHSIDHVLAKGAAGEPYSELERARNQRDRAFVVRLCMQAVNRLFDVSGGHALFLSNPLQRFHRDAQAVSHRAGLMFETVGPLYGGLALQRA
jgi:3-hydroxy-9,10-secoandrosta-1,3,5(10)-triene-9,17-dione monooxygenase